jgi:hypothetical protein
VLARNLGLELSDLMSVLLCFVADQLPSPPAQAPDLRVRVRLGANRPTRGLVVRHVRDRFRMRDVLISSSCVVFPIEACPASAAGVEIDWGPVLSFRFGLDDMLISFLPCNSTAVVGRHNSSFMPDSPYAKRLHSS